MQTKQEKVTNTFNILRETDRMLDDLVRLTYRGNKGSVIDWIVAETYARITGIESTKQNPEKLVTENPTH